MNEEFFKCMGCVFSTLLNRLLDEGQALPLQIHDKIMGPKISAIVNTYDNLYCCLV